MDETPSEALKPDVVEPESESAEPDTPTSITEPSKLIRIASMTRAMLEEVRQSTLDENGRRRLVDIHHESLEQLRDVVSEDLREELERMFVPLTSDAPSEAELRVAQAQLVGWLEGLFHGIQASLWSQQLSTQAQLQAMAAQKAIEAGGDSDQPGLYL